MLSRSTPPSSSGDRMGTTTHAMTMIGRPVAHVDVNCRSTERKAIVEIDALTVDSLKQFPLTLQE